MGTDWPALLLDYETALAEFERVNSALTLALVDRNSSPEDFPHLLAAETQARDNVVLSRMRLINAWREAQHDFERQSPLEAPTKHA